MFWQDELREVIDQGARRICWIVASTGGLSAQLKIEGTIKLIDTWAKSIIVIEDIDCSLNLTGQRKKKEDGEEVGDKKNIIEKKMMENEGENEVSKVTLSGLLNFVDGLWSNFVDGLWSACGGERIIVFTTNFVDKLDPALIRKGRMDKHIELSYCCFEAFKVLAKNYLDVEESELFEEIKRLTPAEVGENFLPKSEEEGTETCLKRLIEALKEEKEEAKRRVEGEEEERKRKKEEKEKAETVTKNKEKKKNSE